MSLSVGARLGSYEVVSALGAGGMGEVYVALDPVLRRRIAVKVLHERAGAADLDRFAREARSASALNHPNIVTIYEFAVASDPPFIAMELIEGKSLRALMDEGQLSLRRAMNIAVQIADGLAAAHEAGIVHRDLKPDNVMVSADGFVKLLDFGLAKPPQPEGDLTARRDSDPTKPGTILGTVAYMSPEQARGDALDYRSDQFSFGIVLYEMLTWRRPFARESWPQTLAAIITDEVDPILQVNPKTPAPLVWAIDRCLEKNPVERYQSTRDLARDLRSIRDHISQAPGSGELVPLPAPSIAWHRWRSQAAAAAIALVLAVGAFAMWRNRVSSGGEPASRSTPSQKEIRHLAVLPFIDLTEQEGDALLGAGLSATVSSTLARIEDLQVIMPRATSDPALSPAQQARDLGAKIVLSGTLQRSGDRLRVTYSIVEADSGRQIAGDTLTALSGDMFLLQDQLSAKVARSLDLKQAPSSPSGSTLTGATSHRYLQAVGYLQRYENAASVDGAINLLESLPHDSALVMAALGKAYLFKFKLTREPQWAQRATEACDRAVALDPQSSDVGVTVGQVRLLQGRLEEASSQFTRALAMRPADVTAILGLAETLHRQQKVSEAEKKYKRAVELQPDFWGVHNQLGAFYMAVGRYSEAAAQFAEVRRLTPDNARGLSNLGGALLQMRRWGEAIEAFKASLALTPSSSGYANLGTAYYFKGQFSEAAEAYRAAIELTPERYVLWIFLGDALRWSGGKNAEADQAFDRAIALAKRELEIDSRDAEVHAQLATCLAKRGRFDEAALQSKRALELAPDDPAIRKEAALVANLTGHEVDAARILRELIAGGWDQHEIRNDPEFANLVNKNLVK